MLNPIDNFLNRITMYRLVLYYLVVVLAAALVASAIGSFRFTPADLLFSTAIITAACWVANWVFARVFDAQPNVESVYITAFILALIIMPVAWNDSAGVGFLIFASVWAMGSKYLFAIGKKHIFNPAAFGVALSATLIGHSATWWVGGNFTLLPFVLIGGLLIVRKLRRFDLFFAFTIVTLATVAFTAPSGDLVNNFWLTLTHTSFFFLGLVMLTEPLTMPPSRTMRLIYAAIVAILFAPYTHIGSTYFTPEIALLIGNIFAYTVSPKGRFMLTLVEKKQIADGTYEFIFTPDRPFAFRAGQYLEWTLAHSPSDSRGNRRFFTIASSPTENTVRLGVKFYSPESTFKRALLALTPGQKISASHLAGEFTMPKDTKEKLVFIAGGIGVTPFRSMAQYLIDTKEARPVTLLYSNKTAAEIAYKDIFDTAGAAGIKTVYAVTNEKAPVPGMHNGFIDAALIEREVPDYKERMFYISGPHAMVEAFKKTLREMGVPRWHVKTDYFPGFV